jgi:AbrB family looped-hinge helix DNA binding protein
MTVTIDAAGRLVIPKEIRERAGLTGGATVNIRVEGGSLILEQAPMQAHLERRGLLSVIVPDEPVEVLTAAQTRRTLEQTRER